MPPHLPIGVSLNLSPGQVLPRNFAAHNANEPQSVIREVAPPPTAALMQPPQRNSYIPSLARRSTHQPGESTPAQQSSALPTTSHRQSLQPIASQTLPARRQSHMGYPAANSLPQPPAPAPQQHQQPVASYSPPRQQQMQPTMTPAMTPLQNRNSLLPQHNPTPQPRPQPPSRNSPNGEHQRPLTQMDIASIGIGMAMLGTDSEDEEDESEPPTPAPAARKIAFVQPPPESEKNPRGGSITPPPTNVSRRMESTPDLAQDESFQIIDLPASQSEESISADRGFGSPPPYSPSAPRRKSLTPPPEPSPVRRRSLTPPPQPNPPTPNSYSRRDLSRITEENASTGSTRSSSRPPRQPSVSMMGMPPPQPPQPAPYAAGQQSPPRHLSPPRRSPERRPGPASISDGRSSTQPSSSSSYASSSTSRMGPLPPRHLPKRLVMPAPLSQSPNVNMQRMSLPPPISPRYGQFTPQPSQHQMLPPPGITSPPSSMRAPLPPPPGPYRPMQMPMHMQMQMQMPHPQQPPMQPPVKVQAQEIQFAPSRVGKLKKRVSMLSSTQSVRAPQPPVTVSFAPPIIGFDRSVAHEKALQRAMTEKVGMTMGMNMNMSVGMGVAESHGPSAPSSKRLLSKRR